MWCISHLSPVLQGSPRGTPTAWMASLCTRCPSVKPLGISGSGGECHHTPRGPKMSLILAEACIYKLLNFKFVLDLPPHCPSSSSSSSSKPLHQHQRHTVGSLRSPKLFCSLRGSLLFLPISAYLIFFGTCSPLMLALRVDNLNPGQRLFSAWGRPIHLCSGCFTQCSQH